MAKLYNCDKKSILKHAKEIGYVCKTRTYKLSEQDKKEIIEKYDIESSAKLSEQYNVSRGMITKLCGIIICMVNADGYILLMKIILKKLI